MTGGSATAVRRRSFRMASTGWAWMSQPSKLMEGAHLLVVERDNAYGSGDCETLRPRVDRRRAEMNHGQGQGEGVRRQGLCRHGRRHGRRHGSRGQDRPLPRHAWKGAPTPAKRCPTYRTWSTTQTAPPIADRWRSAIRDNVMLCGATRAAPHKSAAGPVPQRSLRLHLTAAEVGGQEIAERLNGRDRSVWPVGGCAGRSRYPLGKLSIGERAANENAINSASDIDGDAEQKRSGPSADTSRTGRCAPHKVTRSHMRKSAPILSTMRLALATMSAIGTITSSTSAVAAEAASLPHSLGQAALPAA